MHTYESNLEEGMPTKLVCFDQFKIVYLSGESSQVRLPRLDVDGCGSSTQLNDKWVLSGWCISGSHNPITPHPPPHKSIRQPHVMTSSCVVRIFLKVEDPLLLESHNFHIP
jgi:hypothetical protein